MAWRGNGANAHIPSVPWAQTSSAAHEGTSPPYAARGSTQFCVGPGHRMSIDASLRFDQPGTSMATICAKMPPVSQPSWAAAAAAELRSASDSLRVGRSSTTDREMVTYSRPRRDGSASVMGRPSMVHGSYMVPANPPSSAVMNASTPPGGPGSAVAQSCGDVSLHPQSVISPRGGAPSPTG